MKNYLHLCQQEIGSHFQVQVSQSLSGCSNICGVAKKTGLSISDVSLGPRGALSIRLETQYDHLPQLPQIKKLRRALHRWGGVEMRALISYCATCNVNLCIDCYKMFHKNANITQSKKSLVNQSKVGVDR